MAHAKLPDPAPRGAKQASSKRERSKFAVPHSGASVVEVSGSAVISVDESEGSWVMDEESPSAIEVVDASVVESSLSWIVTR